MHAAGRRAAGCRPRPDRTGELEPGPSQLRKHRPLAWVPRRSLTGAGAAHAANRALGHLLGLATQGGGRRLGILVRHPDALSGASATVLKGRCGGLACVREGQMGVAQESCSEWCCGGSATESDRLHFVRLAGGTGGAARRMKDSCTVTSALRACRRAHRPPHGALGRAALCGGAWWLASPNS